MRTGVIKRKEPGSGSEPQSDEICVKHITPERKRPRSASDRDALPSRQDAYNTDLILEHMIALRAQNELLHRETNTLSNG